MILVVGQSLPAAALKGRAIGAIFMAGFGALWMVIGLRFLQRLGWRSGLFVLLITAALVLAALRDIQRANTLPSAMSSYTSAQAASMNHKFNVIFAAELIAIAVVVILFNLLRRPAFILPVIAVIVGVHFFPLARLFNAPLFYSTGAAMVLTALFALTMREVPRRQAAIGVGCGLVLWITSLVLLLG
jgi:hypothetical protein